MKSLRTLTGCLLILSATSGLLHAQVTDAENKLKDAKTDTTSGWKIGGTIAVNLNQVSLTNWAAGGQNSVSASGLLSLFAHHSHGKSLWENTLDLGYGSIKNGNQKHWWKSDDKVDLMSKYGRKASKYWHYAGLFNFRTQMDNGYNYPNDTVIISKALAPAYVLGALGFDFQRSKNFTAFLAPFTAKATLVNDQTLADAGAFGVEPAVYNQTSGTRITPGEKSRVELGGYVRIFAKKDVMENITAQTKLDLFSNYLEHPENIDVNWQVLVSMKVNKYISATLTTDLIYDDDINIAVDTNNDGVTDKSGPRTQFKEVLGVGFSYKFQ
ncbi:MAG: DUF3078 domain-containing protein [Flavobacteriales bacterium]|nr:DUF3078 domain-containing protein [Flavobacteriales bacterium]MCB9448290.1 DUF3078 domain-containing protein [Flavobacteriales bacterium]